MKHSKKEHNISQIDPDSMVTCTRLTPEFWIQAMRKYDWSPKAQVIFGLDTSTRSVLFVYPPATTSILDPNPVN